MSPRLATGRTYLSLCWLLGLFFSVGSLTNSQASEKQLLPLTPSQSRYQETTGTLTKTFSWTLERAESWLLTSQDQHALYRTWLGQELDTQRWQLDRFADQTSIAAWKNGRFLHIEGTLQGKPVSRSEDLGEHPWYQALSVSLRRHLDQRECLATFWIIRPDTLDLHLLESSCRNRKQAPEGGNPGGVRRIDIRPTGWRALFWKGVYWFRWPDGRFLRYEGEGAPGHPPTTVTLFERGD